MGVQRGPKIPTENLWGCWDAASKSSYPGSGTTWKSLTGSPDATMEASTSYSSFNKGCIYFDGSGSDNVVHIADADLEVTGAFTFSIWVYFTSGINYTVFQLRGGTGWGSDAFAMSMLKSSWIGGHSLRLGCKGAGADGVTMNRYDGSTYGPDQNVNVWRQYVAVYDGVDRKAASSFKFYFDGRYQAPDNTYSWHSNQNGTDWGRDGTSGANGLLQGYLGPVLLYDKAFTASEVWNLHIQQRGRFQ